MKINDWNLSQISGSIAMATKSHSQEMPPFVQKMEQCSHIERDTIQETLINQKNTILENKKNEVKQFIENSDLPNKEEIIKKAISLLNNQNIGVERAHQMPTALFTPRKFQKEILENTQKIDIQNIAKHATLFVLSKELIRDLKSKNLEKQEMADISLQWLDSFSVEKMPIHLIPRHIERTKNRAMKEIEGRDFYCKAQFVAGSTGHLHKANIPNSVHKMRDFCHKNRDLSQENLRHQMESKLKSMQRQIQNLLVQANLPEPDKILERANKVLKDKINFIERANQMPAEMFTPRKFNSIVLDKFNEVNVEEITKQAAIFTLSRDLQKLCKSGTSIEKKSSRIALTWLDFHGVGGIPLNAIGLHVETTVKRAKNEVEKPNNTEMKSDLDLSR